MNVLIVCATTMETELFAKQATGAAQPDILVTGVGSIATTYALTRRLRERQYDLVVQAGVGGSFNEELALGEVVLVTADTYGDLGAEDHDERLDIFDMGLVDRDGYPHKNGWLMAPETPYFKGLRRVRGITVNRVSGSEKTIDYLRHRYGADVESMEGAAFHYVCTMEGVPYGQVRAISNYVIPRDKSTWKMKDAIVNLNSWLTGLVKEW